MHSNRSSGSFFTALYDQLGYHQKTVVTATVFCFHRNRILARKGESKHGPDQVFAPHEGVLVDHSGGQGTAAPSSAAAFKYHG